MTLCGNGTFEDCRDCCRCAQEVREALRASQAVEAPSPVVVSSTPTTTPSARLWLRDRFRPARTREDSPA